MRSPLIRLRLLRSPQFGVLRFQGAHSYDDRLHGGAGSGHRFHEGGDRHAAFAFGLRAFRFFGG